MYQTDAPLCDSETSRKQRDRAVELWRKYVALLEKKLAEARQGLAEAERDQQEGNRSQPL